MAPGTVVMGRCIQNHEIFYLKWKIALEKSILDDLFFKTWHSCAENCFLLRTLLLEPLVIIFSTVNSIFEKKMAKNGQKCWSHAIEIFSMPVVTMVFSGCGQALTTFKTVLTNLSCYKSVVSHACRRIYQTGRNYPKMLNYSSFSQVS